MEIIKLNLIPNGVNPTCHCSQYDEGRVIRIELFDGLTPYTLQSGDTVTLNVRKPDNTIVTTTVETTQGNNYVDIVTTEQICACVGYNLCDLTITNGETVIGTLNFIMAIERDVLADGIPSQSVIEDLDERVAEAVGDNYYTKTETDALLDDKADKSNTYTKTETDALLALKVDKSELYNVYPTEQESGAIASFTDGADNIPVKSLVSQIVAVESGSGEKSPDNPYTISGFDSGVITRCGKNWLDKSLLIDQVAWNVFTLHLAPNTTYTMSSNLPSSATSEMACCVFPSSGNPSSSNLVYSGHSVTLTTLSDGLVKIQQRRVSGTDSFQNYNWQIENGSTATNFEAYNGNNYAFAFGQTVYGGHFDNKGNFVVTHNIVDLSTINWSYASDAKRWRGLKSDMKNYQSRSDDIIFEKYETDTSSTIGSENKGYISGAYIYVHSTDDMTQPNGNARYPLNTPITLSITSRDIPTALGENNFYSDTGDVDVTIRADIGLYIEKRLNTTRSTPTLSLSKGNSTLSETQVKYEDPVEEVKDPVEESEDNDEER